MTESIKALQDLDLDVQESILRRFKHLLNERVSLEQVILFGSRARKDADPDSDMDLVVILSDSADEGDREKVSDCAWEAGFDHGIVLVPIVFTKSEWQGPERYSLLAQAVLSEGITV